MGPYGIGTLGALLLLALCDKKRRWLGEGDYLILWALSVGEAQAFPLVLLASSLLALGALAVQKSRSVPLVPFLFLGELVGRTAGLLQRILLGG